ncbi:MAG: hypothetical protein HQK49_12985 [Oligoflexia bacterium]|nr:hypothetical protein [Oligoflexia bacterium]
MKEIKKKISELFSALLTNIKQSSNNGLLQKLFVFFLYKLKLNKFINLEKIKDLKAGGSKKLATYEFGAVLKKIGKRFFDVNNRPTIHKIFIITTLMVLPYVFGKMVALILTTTDNTVQKANKIYIPSDLESDFARDIEKIQSSNLFHAKLLNDMDESGKKKKVGNENVICTVAQIKSSLPIKLVSTIVLQNSSKSIASILVGGGENDLKSVREGDKIPEMATVGKIERLKIVFRSMQSGECEYVADEEELLTRAKGGKILSARDGKKLITSMKQMDGIKNNGDQFFISRKLFNDKMQEIDRVLRDARAVPMQNPDGSMSFKITELVPGSIYSYLGIEDNDKITKINGKKIAGLNEIMNLFASLQNIEKLQLTVVKEDGNEHTFNYAFSK